MFEKSIITVGLLFISAFYGCSSNKSGNPLAGKWEIVNATGTLADMNIGTIYRFGDHAEFSTEKGGYKIEGTYSVSGDTIRSVFGSILITALYKIEGDKMQYQILNSDQKFQLSKK